MVNLFQNQIGQNADGIPGQSDGMAAKARGIQRISRQEDLLSSLPESCRKMLTREELTDLTRFPLVLL